MENQTSHRGVHESNLLDDDDTLAPSGERLLVHHCDDHEGGFQDAAKRTVDEPSAQGQDCRHPSQDEAFREACAAQDHKADEAVAVEQIATELKLRHIGPDGELRRRREV